jgi:hypothetical protein
MKRAASFSVLLAFAISGCDPAADQRYAENVVALTIDPLEGPTEGGTRLAIQGAALCSDLVVTFNGVPSPKVEVISSEVALVEAPSHILGAAQIVLQCGSQGTFQFPELYRYFPSHIGFDSLIYPPTDEEYQLADFNADGLEDLLAIERDDHQFMIAAVVQLNLGNGGFAETPFLAFDFGEMTDSDTGRTIQVGDFTEDGINDLLCVTNRLEQLRGPNEPWTRSLDMQLFKSELGHNAPVLYIIGDGVFDEAADYNGDGLFDVSGKVTIDVRRLVYKYVFWEQDSTGNFVRYEFDTPDLYHTTFLLEPARAASTVPINDFNQDGFSDVATAARIENAGQRYLQLSYYLGRATGGPQVITTSVAFDSLYYAPNLVFWNDDALPDLLFLNTATRALDSFELRLSTDIAQFADQTRMDTECDHDCPSVKEVSPIRLDLNRDGNGEHFIRTYRGGGLLRHDGRIVSVNHDETRGVWAAHLAEREPAALVFGEAPIRSASLDRLGYRISGAPILARDVTAFCLGDLDGDSLDDLITVLGTGGSVEARVARTDGGFGAPRTIGAPTQWQQRCRVADFNLDGENDVALEGIRFLINLDGETFEERAYADVVPIVATSGLPIAVHLGPSGDLAWAFIDPERDRVGMFRWEGQGFLVAEQGDLESVTFGSSTVLMDFNRDSTLDVVVHEVVGTERAIIAYRGSLVGGALVFTEDQRIPLSHERYVGGGAEDFDGDGWSDLIFGEFYRNNNGTFEQLTIDAPSIPMLFQKTCDIDGDNKKDLLFTGHNGLLGWAPARATGYVLETLAIPDAAFESPYRDSQNNIACADIDRDPLLDVVYINLPTNTVHRLRNDTR